MKRGSAFAFVVILLADRRPTDARQTPDGRLIGIPEQIGLTAPNKLPEPINPAEEQASRGASQCRELWVDLR